MQNPVSPEKGGLTQSNPERIASTVRQPERFAGLESILAEINKVSEPMRASPGEQWSGGQQQDGTAAQAQAGNGPSPRDEAIEKISVEPAVLQRQLERQIRREVQSLRKEARKVTRMSLPGSAWKLTQLYARIRRLNLLLNEIFEASYETLKRLFIRVFIDKQSVL